MAVINLFKNLLKGMFCFFSPSEIAILFPAWFFRVLVENLICHCVISSVDLNYFLGKPPFLSLTVVR